ncbi:hypothetical protein F4859DRAFT_467833 [Xylaria cf. heliscus]|nr:hypothetical protein F4859DRAFT_467833 [Xylaria cf. heliscus]
MANITHHSELISVLTEFYTLLTSLGVVPADTVCLPDANTGTHPDGAINTDVAAAVGYAPEAIELMNALPYLAVDELRKSFQLLPSTYPVTYIGAGEGPLLAFRALMDETEMPPTALQLTSFDIHGIIFVYDTVTKLMTPWEPLHNPEEENGYFHVTGASPREVLSPIIDDYRKLKHLATPKGIDFSDPSYASSGGVPPKDLRPDEQRRWVASYAVWAATQKLRDIYLECGWDVDAIEQTTFSLDEYLSKREAYWREIVEPLIEVEKERSDALSPEENIAERSSTN